jgi:hypothetical protein
MNERNDIHFFPPLNAGRKLLLFAASTFMLCFPAGSIGWQCQYSGDIQQYKDKYFDCNYPTRGKWRGNINTLMRSVDIELDSLAGLDSLLRAWAVEDWERWASIRTAIGFSMCVESDPAPLSRPEVRKTGPGQNSNINWYSGMSRVFVFGGKVNWTTHGCGNWIDFTFPTPGTTSANGGFQRLDVCEPSVVFSERNSIQNGDIESAENVICYYRPSIDDNQTDTPGKCTFPGFGNPIYPLNGTKNQREEIARWLGGDMVVEYDTRRKLPGAAFSLTPLPSFGPLWQSLSHRRHFGDPGLAGWPELV